MLREDQVHRPTSFLQHLLRLRQLLRRAAVQHAAGGGPDVLRDMENLAHAGAVGCCESSLAPIEAVTVPMTASMTVTVTATATQAPELLRPMIGPASPTTVIVI